MTNLLFCGKILGTYDDREDLGEDQYHFFDFVPSKELWEDSTPRTIYFDHSTGVIQFYDTQFKEVQKTVQLNISLKENRL